MEKQPNGAKQPESESTPERVPEPAESFEIDFLNARSAEVTNAMLLIGAFVFRSSGQEDESRVSFKGGRGDGTTIEIIIEKGDSYKSPAEIAREEQETGSAD